MEYLADKINKLLPHKKINIFNDDILIISSIPYFFNIITIIYGLMYMEDSAFVIFGIYYIMLPLLDEFV
jgi:hypothetical protein